jgi:hypothetical protein
MLNYKIKTELTSYCVKLFKYFFKYSGIIHNIDMTHKH